MKKTLVIGTRGSALALWQAEHVQARLKKRFRSLDVELRIIKTKGDKILEKSETRVSLPGKSNAPCWRRRSTSRCTA